MFAPAAAGVLAVSAAGSTFISSSHALTVSTVPRSLGEKKKREEEGASGNLFSCSCSKLCGELAPS
jgi:hypothetical protein